MKRTRIEIDGIPAIVWGEKSDKVYLFVHGKMSSKESAGGLAEIAEAKGYQTISFDLPQHGERTHEDRRCDIWNGMHDLSIIGDYAFSVWKEVSLYACSLGAYFCLYTYDKLDIKKCLFQSPIIDMEYLIKQMMIWYDISEERLYTEKEINTPIDIMSWKYYKYAKEHPISVWSIKTSILFAGKDTFQSTEVINDFADRFGCKLTVAENSDHPFMAQGDADIVDKWLLENL